MSNTLVKNSPTSSLKFYIIAGERSGDLHGGNLVKSIRKQNPHTQFRGFGGEEMQNAGVMLVMHYDQLAFMGFQAIFNLFQIAKYMYRCKKDILAYQPTALILIDYGGFNRRIAKFGKKHGITVFYYIPPKVWAWRQNRAWQLKRDVDHMYVIFPFEKDFFKKYQFHVEYVGNPVLDATQSFTPNPLFLSTHGLDKNAPIVALLPGSRKMEVQRIVPLMAKVAQLNSSLSFVVATVKNIPNFLYAPLQILPNVKMVCDCTYDLLSVASAAIVTSGTATLETSLFKVPQVVVYKAGAIEYLIASQVVKVDYISPVNLIAGKEVVKELIQQNANVNSINLELNKLLNDSTYRNLMRNEYTQLYELLNTGSASDNTARLILASISPSKAGV